MPFVLCPRWFFGNFIAAATSSFREWSDWGRVFEFNAGLSGNTGLAEKP